MKQKIDQLEKYRAGLIESISGKSSMSTGTLLTYVKTISEIKIALSVLKKEYKKQQRKEARENKLNYGISYQVGNPANLDALHDD